jgi:hypothetical protein
VGNAGDAEPEKEASPLVFGVSRDEGAAEDTPAWH